MMAARKGFSLIELIVALVVVGVVAALTLPNFTASIEQTNAATARNNLLAISAAQEKYFEDYGSYYYGSGANLISTLHLSLLANDPFSYSCTNAASPYQCTATDGIDTLTLNAGVVTCVNVNGNSGYCPY